MNEVSNEKRILGWGKYEFGMIIMFFMAWGFIFLDRLTISFLAPFVIGELNITAIQYGLIGTATTGCFAVSAIVFGAVSDYSGVRKKWLIPFVLGAAIFSGAGAFTDTFGQLIITRAMVGFCEGPILPLIMAIVAKESTPSRWALNASLVNMGVAIIAITLGPVFTTQVALAYDWRMAFLLASIPTFLLGLLMIKVIREVRVVPSLDVNGKKENAIQSLGKLLKYRNIVLCFLISMFSMAGYWTLNLYTAIYFSTEGGREMSSVGAIMSLGGLIGLCWGIIIPKLSDAIGRKPALIIAFILAALVPLAMYGVPTSMAAVALYCVLAGMGGCINPMLYSVIPAETLPANLIGTAAGLILGFAEITGGALWPAISGFVIQKSGLPIVMLVGGLAFLIAMVLALFVKETYTKEKREAMKAGNAVIHG